MADIPESRNPGEGDVTRLLSRHRAGDAGAADQLVPIVYEELRGLAANAARRRGPTPTLQPTALVHEAWMKLVGRLGSVQDKHHFLVLAGKVMRQLISNHARDQRSLKRGGALQRVVMEDSLQGTESEGVSLVDLDDCLQALAERNARLAQITELRLLSGLTLDETAEVLGISARSVDSDWALAKAWLTRALRDRE